MSKRTVTSLLAAAVAAAALALAGVASASPAHANALRTVTIAMHDPGCHWFQVGSSFQKRLTVHGATMFRNLDEAALVFKGNGVSRHLAVGKTLVVSKPGTYRIDMVGQAPDDNHLLLVVR